MSISRIAIFLSVVVGLTVTLHYYLWTRLVRDPGLPEPWRQLATGALILLGLSIPATMLAWRFVPRSVAIPISWLGYVWMGAMFVTLVLLWSGEFARWSWVKYAQLSAIDSGRRKFWPSFLQEEPERWRSRSRAGESGRRSVRLR